MITSVENQLVKKVTSLQKKKYRDEYKQFVVEGIKSINEAVNANFEIDQIIYSPELTKCELKFPKVEVTKEIMIKICDTITPQGIIAVCKTPDNNIDTIKNLTKILYLDKVQDPGNVGTIIRTADAFGFSAAILSTECADVYSPKVIRATMGSLFHIPIIQNIHPKDLVQLKKKIYASSLENSINLNNVEIEENSILVIGNEGQGISDEIKKVSDIFVKIPMQGKAESLNASIAAGILMYEFSK